MGAKNDQGPLGSKESTRRVADNETQFVPHPRSRRRSDVWAGENVHATSPFKWRGKWEGCKMHTDIAQTCTQKRTPGCKMEQDSTKHPRRPNRLTPIGNTGSHPKSNKDKSRETLNRARPGTPLEITLASICTCQGPFMFAMRITYSPPSTLHPHNSPLTQSFWGNGLCTVMIPRREARD